MKSFSVVALTFAVTISTAFAKEHFKVHTHQDVIKRYTYWKVASVVDYFSFLQEADDAAREKKILACDPSLEQARDIFGGELHSLADGARRPELDRYLKNPVSYVGRIKTCVADCSCNAIAMVLADADLTLNDKAEHNRNKTDLDASIKAQPKDQDLVCAKKMTWYCGSGLQTYLYKSK